MEVEEIAVRTIKNCSVCLGEGTYRDKIGRLNQCGCTRAYREFLRYKEADIPAPYWDKTLEDYVNPNKEAIEKIQLYMNTIDSKIKNGVGIYLWGGFGVGKTGLACEILKMVLRSGKYSGQFFLFPKLVTVLSGFDLKSPEEKAEAEGQIDSKSLVVIDDIGREYRREGSSYIGSLIDSFFRQRMNQQLPIIITSNYPMHKSKDLYGESIYSIFMGNLISLEVEGNDYRMLDLQRRLTL